MEATLLVVPLYNTEDLFMESNNTNNFGKDMLNKTKDCLPSDNVKSFWKDCWCCSCGVCSVSALHQYPIFGILQETPGSSKYFHVQFFQLNLYTSLVAIECCPVFCNL